MAKSEERKIAEINERQGYVKLAVNTVLQLLKNPLTAGLIGYMAVSFAGQLQAPNGKPYMAEGTTIALKGMAAGYPLAAALGGFGGMAAAAGVAGAVGIAESDPASWNLDLGNVARSAGSGFLDALRNILGGGIPLLGR